MRGDKDDLRLAALRAKQLGKLNAIHILHFNIQKQNVKAFVALVGKPECFRTPKAINSAICADGLRPLGRNAFQLPGLRRVIVANGDTV